MWPLDLTYIILFTKDFSSRKGLLSSSVFTYYVIKQRGFSKGETISKLGIAGDKYFFVSMISILFCFLNLFSKCKCKYIVCDIHTLRSESGWQKSRRKVWTWTKILSPNLRYFDVISRFVAIYALLERLWAKKCSFGSKKVFLGQEMHYYMVHIAYHTELILPFAIMRKNNANVKIANTRLRKLLWLFLPSPKGCQLLPP